MDKDLSIIMEWAVWANLDRENNVELILLKGHLFIEVLLNYVLRGNGLKKHTKYSFFNKIQSLLLIQKEQIVPPDVVAPFLFRLNSMRNQLAHEFRYDITNSEIEIWSQDVLTHFHVVKNTRYTFRTRIVHAFAALARVLGEMSMDTNFDLFEQTKLCRTD